MQTDRMAIVRVALRQRETLALLRVRDKAIVLQTMLWPDEVREPEFDILDTDVELRPQELTMAASLVESLGADFDPTDFHDEYRDAVVELIEQKRTTGETRPAPVAEKPDDGDSMTDLLSALQASVEAARTGGSKVKATPEPADEPEEAEPAEKAEKPASSRSGSSRGRKAATRKESADEDKAPRKRTRRPA